MIDNMEVWNQSFDFDSRWVQRMQLLCRMLLICRQTTEGSTLVSGGQGSSPQSNPKQHGGQQPQPQRTATCILQTSSCTALQTEERRVEPLCLERVHQLAAIVSSMRITTPASAYSHPSPSNARLQGSDLQQILQATDSSD